MSPCFSADGTGPSAVVARRGRRDPPGQARRAYEMSDHAGPGGAAPADDSGATPAQGSVTVVHLADLRRTVAATAIGNMIEWFDFGVFSFTAVTIGLVFFPEASRSAQLLSAFATFAAAFLIR